MLLSADLAEPLDVRARPKVSVRVQTANEPRRLDCKNVFATKQRRLAVDPTLAA